MKKYIALALSATMLAGCTSQKQTYQTTVDNGNTVVFKTADGSVTKQDVYEELMKNYGAQTVLSQALKQIANQEAIDQKLVDQAVEEQLNSMKALLGDTYETTIKDSLGFASEEEFIEKQIMPSVRQTLLLGKYVDDHFDALLTEFNFVKLQMITVGSEEEATDLIAKISAGETTFADSLSKSTSQATDLGIVFEKAPVDQAIIDNLKDFTVNSLYTIPLPLSTGSYGVVNIVETDESKLTDEIKTTLKNNPSIASKSEIYYLHQYNFKSLDKKLTEDINAISPQYLGEAEN